MTRLFFGRSVNRLLITVAILWIGKSAFAQCENSDFELGTFQNWIGFTGGCCPINAVTPGLVANQHTIVTGSGFDPQTCGLLPMVAPGSIYSAKLGNENVGGQAERLNYNFAITPQTSLIIFKYAVILEDPGHSPSEQPRFEAQLLDQNGVPIPCTFYSVTASAGLPGFQNCGTVVFKDWTIVGVDASAYIGQTVTLDFATGDCSLGGHFGYAYVDAACAAFQLEARYCIKNSDATVTVSAPEGFAQYNWSTGDTGNEIIITNPTQGQVVTCQITSSNGCIANLSATLQPSDVDAAFTPATGCVGDTLNLVNESILNNAVLDTVTWTSSDGFQQAAFDFSHVYTNSGSYNLQMIVQSDANCIDTVEHIVQIFETPKAGFQLNDICVGDALVLNSQSTILGTDLMTHTWDIGGLSTLTGSPASFTFTNPDTIQIKLTSLSSNNCPDDSSLQIIVYGNPTADFSLVEVCMDSLVRFTNLSDNHSIDSSYAWIYNGGTISTDYEINRMFTVPGLNTISLVSYDTYPTVTCDDTMTKTFFVHDIPHIQYLADLSACKDVEFVVTNQSTIVAGETMTYEWAFEGDSVASSTDLTFVLADTGSYTFSITATSDFGCQADSTFVIDLFFVPEKPIVSGNILDCPGDLMYLSATAEANSSISWTGPNNFTSNSFSVITPIGVPGIGVYTAFVTSQAGCASDTANVGISIINYHTFDDFIFPNVITSNHDQINEELNLKAYFKSCIKYELQIFNRWGNLVFEQNQDSEAFKGNTTKGEELNEGVYFYKLMYENGMKSGYVQILK